MSHALPWPRCKPGNLCDVWTRPVQKEQMASVDIRHLIVSIYPERLSKKQFESYLVYCYPVPWAALISRCDSESDCSIWDFTPLLVHLQLHQRCIHLERELGKTAGCKNWQVTDRAWLLKIIRIPCREQFHLGTFLFLPNYQNSSSGELWRQLF